MDCSPRSTSLRGILWARILEQIAISFSRGSSPPRDRTHVSCTGRWILYHQSTREAKVTPTLSIVCAGVQAGISHCTTPGGAIHREHSMPPESCNAAVLKLLPLEEGIRAPVVLRCCFYLESQGSVLLQLTFLEESTPLSLANLKQVCYSP